MEIHDRFWIVYLSKILTHFKRNTFKIKNWKMTLCVLKEKRYFYVLLYNVRYPYKRKAEIVDIGWKKE